MERQNLRISTIRSGKGDCIRIRFIGLSGTPRNIIVDSGPTSSSGEFRKLTDSIIRNGEHLDILIITHYDEDHIGGILKVGDSGFKSVYFNAYDGIEESENLSALQAQRLFQILPSAEVHSSVLAGDEIDLDGAKVKVIAPMKGNLSAAMDKMKDAQLAAASDWNYTFSELMQQPLPSPDSSISNRASIVFVFEFDDYRALFCGDAPADSIIDGLKDCKHFDLVKLPHHGSSRNISDELISLFDTDSFLICADGTAHPNKQTIARLLKNKEKVKLYSNYSWWLKGFLKPEDKQYLNRIDFKVTNEEA